MPHDEQACCADSSQSNACCDAEGSSPRSAPGFTRQILTLFGLVFGVVLLVVVLGEWLGLFDAYTHRVPWPVGLAVVLAGGYPVFRNVVRAAIARRVTSHTLMTMGVLAALALGEWATATVVVIFMRVADFAERFTTERARRALRSVTELAPQIARTEDGGTEREVRVEELHPGDIVIVRPGERIPVDGDVVAGHAAVDQSAITGESMPVDVGPASRVFAATIAAGGSLRVRATHIGPDSTFGRVIHMVEQAERHRADVQRWADRFSAYYLPVVVAIATSTLVFRHDVLASAAVLVVACSCSFALATPVAMLASIGASARRGLLIKGGKYLEALALADVLLIDKTGTLTLGRPTVGTVRALNGLGEQDVLALAAAAERDSEHPLAEAVRTAARQRRLVVEASEEFRAIPGIGVMATVAGHAISVAKPGGPDESGAVASAVAELGTQGGTLLVVSRDRKPVGVITVTDTVRREVASALARVRELGIRDIELLTGDNDRAAAALAEPLGLAYRANLLPEDKIAIVKSYQAQGRRVVMVGDGVNDAPALAQADVGVAMGAAGTDVAVDAAHLVLMRDDWRLVPAAIMIARRTMRVVKLNIAFTAVYNLVGLGLAAFGLLPLVLAAVAQSLPDLGILANASRLLRPPTER